MIVPTRSLQLCRLLEWSRFCLLFPFWEAHKTVSEKRHISYFVCHYANIRKTPLSSLRLLVWRELFYRWFVLRSRFNSQEGYRITGITTFGDIYIFLYCIYYNIGAVYFPLIYLFNAILIYTFRVIFQHKILFRSQKYDQKKGGNLNPPVLFIDGPPGKDQSSPTSQHSWPRQPLP